MSAKGQEPRIHGQGPLPTLAEKVTVKAEDASKPIQADGVQPDRELAKTASGAEVTATAGTYGDIPRYVQTLPGVSFDSDARNGYLVNGGNPLENLVVVDGVEIPNLNYISTASTSGGFVSMLDTDSVASVTLHTMLYGPQYTGALSSVLDVETVRPEDGGLHGEANVGFAGADLLLNTPLKQGGATLLELRKSVINYVTNDIGIDGVPKYASILSTTHLKRGDRDDVSVFYLQGVDSLAIRPNLDDVQDPGFLDTTYSGNRLTGAVSWQHHWAELAQQQLQVIFSRVRSTTLQTDALSGNSVVVNERLLDAPFTVRDDVVAGAGHVEVSAGVLLEDHGLNYRVQQPNGLASPYRVDPTAVDPSNVIWSRSALDYAAYGVASWAGPLGFEVTGGARLQHFGIDGKSVVSPQLELRSPRVHGAFMYGGVAQYSQLPPTPVLLGFAGNASLPPIRVTQTQAGMVLVDGAGGRLELSAYRKQYTHYPVSSEFPSLSLADTVDLFGQPNLAMPMIGVGSGLATGVQAQYATSVRRRAFAQVNVASQQVRHKALDGIARLANYDVPFTLNALGGVRLGRRHLLTGRYTQHTGTPYTPFLVEQSQQQHRPIYDLTQINTERGSLYARLDLRYAFTASLRGHAVNLYAGMENVLDRQNFYQYAIISNCSFCGPYELTQQGRLAEGGVAFHF